MSTHERASTPRYPVSDHCDGRRFFTPGAPPLPTLGDVWRWKRSASGRVRWPSQVPLPPLPPRSERPEAARSRATWINHSTFLLETPLCTLITDPVFSLCCGPFGLLGPRRVHAPGLPFDALPKIDVVLLSHDHYDHCDLPSLARLARRFNPIGVTPLGNGDLLERAGFSRIVELDWWHQATPLPGLSVTVTPTQHWSKRATSARCSRLWGGFNIETAGTRTLFVGDTAYHPNFFKDIRTRLGAPDLALIPMGAYEPRWFMKSQHVNPEEAVRIHQELAAKQSVAMHWGTFCLTDEGRDTPPQALALALAEAGLPASSFQVLDPGAALSY